MDSKEVPLTQCDVKGSAKDHLNHGDGTTFGRQKPKHGRTEKTESLVKEARKSVALLLQAIEEGRKAAPMQESSPARTMISLKAFASSESITVEKFKQSGGLKTIVTAIRKYSSSSDVVDSGCSALAALTLYASSTITEMVNAGAIESVVIAVEAQACGGTEDACVSALKTLRNLTQTEENRTQIWEAEGIEAVVKAMTEHTESPRIMSHAALVLSNLAFGNNEIKEAVGNLGGLAAIAQGMKKHKDFQAVQARGSLALRNLCYQSEVNQRNAGENGGAEALLAAIEFYIDDREVVHQSCVALMNLSSVSEENRTRITEAKGGAILVKLMKTYADSATVHDDCISIIRNVAVGSSAAQLEIGLHGGVACICRGMEMFPKNAKLADKSCSALRYLCFLAENRVKVRESRGIEAIIAALKVNKYNASPVENALLALGNATFESEENKGIVGRCGGILAIIDAVEQHRLNAAIQEHGCRVLRNLADGFEFNRRLEAESGGIKMAVFAMIGFPEHASIQEQACAMLLNMALSASNIDKLAQADVERLAEKALNAHAKHRGVQLQAGSLLDRMNGYDVGGVGEVEAPLAEQEGASRRGLRGFLSYRGGRPGSGRHGSGRHGSLRGNQDP